MGMAHVDPPDYEELYKLQKIDIRRIRAELKREKGFKEVCQAENILLELELNEKKEMTIEKLDEMLEKGRQKGLDEARATMNQMQANEEHYKAHAKVIGIQVALDIVEAAYHPSAHVKDVLGSIIEEIKRQKNLAIQRRTDVCPQKDEDRHH